MAMSAAGSLKAELALAPDASVDLIIPPRGRSISLIIAYYDIRVDTFLAFSGLAFSGILTFLRASPGTGVVL
jgi:hypothetical protein